MAGASLCGSRAAGVYETAQSRSGSLPALDRLFGRCSGCGGGTPHGGKGDAPLSGGNIPTADFLHHVIRYAFMVSVQIPGVTVEQYKDSLCDFDDGCGNYNRNVLKSGNRKVVHGCGDVSIVWRLVENERNFCFLFIGNCSRIRYNENV